MNRLQHRILTALTLATSLAAAGAVAQPSRTPWLREPEEIRRTLDSLATVSIGSYVHFAVGSCIGGRCEERISLHRDAEGAAYRYRAGAWVGLPSKPQFYGFTRELPEEEAGVILADARLAGIMSLIADSQAVDRRQPRFWLRARFGERTVTIDGASLGGASYAASVAGGPGELYDRVEKALFAPLREQFRRRSGEE